MEFVGCVYILLDWAGLAFCWSLRIGRHTVAYCAAKAANNLADTTSTEKAHCCTIR